MNRSAAPIFSSCLLAACGGGAGSSAPDEAAMLARWYENVSQVSQVTYAIAQCALSSDRVLGGRCDSLVLLTSRGFLPRNYTLVASQFESAAPVIARGTAALVLVGNEKAGNCTVTITLRRTEEDDPDSLNWVYTNQGGTHCDHAATRTRIGWSDNISRTKELRTAIEECAQRNRGVLTGNCDSMRALSTNGFLPAGYVVNASANLASAIVTAGAAAIVLSGTLATDNCVVTIVPTMPNVSGAVTWSYLNTAPCGRLHTGVGT